MSPEMAIGIGTQKSGTSSLWRALRRQPWFQSAAMKELHFFTLHYHRGTDWYLRQFGPPSPGRVLGEITPNYMSSATAAGRIGAHFPAARLFAVLRNPVDRAYSAFHHGRRRGDFPARMTFEEALAAEPRRVGTPFSDLFVGGLYFRHLQPYLRRFPTDRVHIALFEELSDPGSSALDDLLRFVGNGRPVAPGVLPQINAHRSAGWIPTARLRTRAISLARRRDLPTVANTLIELEIRLSRRRSQQRPEPMAPTTRARLLERYAPENAALGELLGRDLAGWER